MHSRAEYKLLSDFSKVKYQKTEIKISLTSLFVVCGLILLPSELFQIVISCQIVNSSMMSKFVHKNVSIQETFQPAARAGYITRLGAGSGPRVVHPCCT